MKKSLLCIVAMMMMVVYVNAQKDSTLQQYSGRYTFPAGSAVTEATVELADSILSIHSAMGSATLQRVEGDVFSLVEYGGTALFSRNEGGKVNAIRVQVADMDLSGTKDAITIFWLRQNLLFKGN